MGAPTADKDVRRALREAREMVEQLLGSDGNEAETRRRVERIFENVLGYDTLKHLTRERAVKGAGETEHVDFAIQLEEGPKARPVIMVELKRVSVDLATKHLKQVASYAIDAGCEWVVLTNSREWRVYHVEFGQPPVTSLLAQWNLLTEEPAALLPKLEILSYRFVRKGGLDDLWRRTKVLAPKSLLAAVLSDASLRFLRRSLRGRTGVLIEFEEIVQGIRRLLNEAAATEMDGLRIRLPQRKQAAKDEGAAAERAKPETAPPGEASGGGPAS